MKYFFILLLLSTNLLAQSVFYTFNNNGKSEKIEINLYKKVKIDINCFKAKKSCLAIKALSSKVSKKSSSGNPYSFYCQQVNGRPIILEDSKRNQYDFCQFTDQSMISSFDLYKERSL